MSFLHLAVWSMFPCHHFWWIHFTHNTRLSHGCLKSEPGAGEQGLLQGRDLSPVSLLAVVLGGTPHLTAVSIPVFATMETFLTMQKKAYPMVTTTRTKEQGWALASVFMCKASTTHTACEWKRCKGDANTVRDNYSRGRGRGSNFQMKSGSAAPRWVSEEEPPQRSLTPLYCLAELLLAASLLLSYFLGKLQKFTAFSQCPQQQFWATCTTTALIKPYKEKSKDDRQHSSLHD